MTRNLLPIVLLFLPLAAHAQDGDAYLVAWPGREGSISMGGTTPGVWVRWDVTEGEIPADVTSLTLYRDGTALVTAPTGAVMSAAEIDALYAAPGNDRRRLEMIRWLDGLDPAITVDVATLGEAVALQLETDPLWAWLASRIDPVIASVRYRAFFDSGATGTVVYQLRGQTTAGPEIVMGRVAVDATAAPVVPAPLDLRQIPVHELSRCDAPEEFRAHGLVALNWETPGASAPERVIWDLALAGYDIYRSVGNVAAAPPRDLAAEAAALTHGLDGQVTFANLEKVNDQPVVITRGAPERQAGYDGWAPAIGHHVESLAELAARGVSPGDTRAYYVVARDLTGNYGATASVLVEVPDLLPPPTPWDVHSVARPALATAGAGKGDRIILRWPEVNLSNYVADYGTGRTFCNLESARVERRLQWVTAGLCPGEARGEADGALMTSNLDVERYVVYRFDSIPEARAFADQDLDGHADAAERTVITDPGAACDPSTHPPGSGHRVAELTRADVTTTSNGRRILQLEDVGPAQIPGRIYWYRVVAVGRNGAVSSLSAPARAMFPSYGRRGRKSFGTPQNSQGCYYELVVHGEPSKPLADDLSGDAASVQLTCDAGGVHNGTLAATPTPPRQTHDWSAQQCQNFDQACPGLPGRKVQVTYLDDLGLPLATTLVDWHGDPRTCDDLNSRLSELCPAEGPPAPGGVAGLVPLDFPDFDPEDSCIGVYRQIGERLQRIELICDQLTLDEGYEVEGLGSSLVCLYTAVHDANGKVSPKLPLGCVGSDAAFAQPPQPISLVFDEGASTARITIKPPDQRIVGTILEWRREDGTDRQTAFVPQPSQPGLFGQVISTVALGAPYPLEGQREVWCFRARTVISQSESEEVADSLSEWTSDLCATRLGPSAVEPTYLPWPAIPRPAEGEPLSALYLSGDEVPVVALAPYTNAICDLSDTCVYAEPQPPPGCDPSPSNPCDPVPGNMDVCLPLLVTIQCEVMTCDDLRAMLGGALGFVVYRQSREGPGADPQPYVQVSPRIDLMHCLELQGGNLKTIADPFISLANFSGFGAPLDGDRFVFVDRSPHQGGREYRYQFVYFDERGEIMSFRTSGWIDTTVVP